ncbi:MAG: APC family permease [Methanomicrobiales archaeon]|nr:APC family permease [Methanomicrobiales archaeon]
MAAIPGLKRDLGLWEVTLSGVGIILGAGIYALIGEAAGLAGNAVWLAFVISAAIALCTGLSYAELSSLFPRAGAEYEYVKHAFGRRAAFVIGWLIIFSGVIGASTVALGFAGYAARLLPLPLFLWALLLIAGISVLLLLGIRISAAFAIVFTLIEIGGLITVIVIGLPSLGDVDYLAMPAGGSGVLAAAALVFFAYIGFEDLVKLAEETKSPRVNIPRGLLLAMAISTILYILVALAAVSVLPWEALAESHAPFAALVETALGPTGAAAITLVALFATANTVLLMLLASSRIIYGMATSRALPRFLARLDPVRSVPYVATLLVGILAAATAVAGNLVLVAQVTNFTLFLTFASINSAVILLRFREPARERPFRIPVSLGRMPLFPLAGLLSTLLLFSQLDLQVLLIGGILTAAGIVVGWRETGGAGTPERR